MLFLIFFFQLVEFDKPAKLWANKSSEFYRLMYPTIPSGESPDQMFEHAINPDSPSSSASSEQTDPDAAESPSPNHALHDTSGSAETYPTVHSDNTAGANATEPSASSSNNLTPQGHGKAPLATVEHISEHELNTSSSGSISGLDVEGARTPLVGNTTDHDKAPLVEEV